MFVMCPQEFLRMWGKQYCAVKKARALTPMTRSNRLAGVSSSFPPQSASIIHKNIHSTNCSTVSFTMAAICSSNRTSVCCDTATPKPMTSSRVSIIDPGNRALTLVISLQHKCAACLASGYNFQRRDLHR